MKMIDICLFMHSEKAEFRAEAQSLEMSTLNADFMGIRLLPV